MNIWDKLTTKNVAPRKFEMDINQVKLTEAPLWVEAPEDQDSIPGGITRSLISDQDRKEDQDGDPYLPGLSPELLDDSAPEVDKKPEENGSPLDHQPRPGDRSILPTGSVCLGFCEDGLPFVFDFNDAAPGPILVSGDWQLGPAQLFERLLSSALRLNSPRTLRYGILSEVPGQWEQSIHPDDKRRSIGIVDIFSKEADLLILTLVERGRQVALGLQPPRIHLILIDNLEAFDSIDFDIRLSLEWLLREGPRLGIWIFAYCDPAAVVEKRRLRMPFHSHILGHIPDMNQARLTADSFQMPKGTWPQRNEMVFWGGEELLRFLPAAGST